VSGMQPGPSTPHEAYLRQGPTLANCPEPHSSSSGSVSSGGEASAQSHTVISDRGGEFEYQARKGAD
jgi:hypothetical protein